MVTDDLVLVDQHCHGVVAGELGGGEVAGWLTEADRVPEGRDPFESMLGLAVRRWCGPVSGLPGLVGRDEYLKRRGELGWREVTRRLLGAAGVGTWLVDTGFVPGPTAGSPGSEAEPGSMRGDIAGSGASAGLLASGVEPGEGRGVGEASGGHVGTGVEPGVVPGGDETPARSGTSATGLRGSGVEPGEVRAEGGASAGSGTSAVARWGSGAPGEGGASTGLVGRGVGVEREVVRVEVVAEEVARGGVAAAGLVEAIREELWRRARGAVGLKTIVGYRWGLGVPGVGPGDGEARRAGERWLRGGAGRLTEPVLLHWLVHEAARVGAELRLPVQVHAGFGDADLRLREVDPVLLTDFVRAHPSVTMVLLHCWPYHRNAAYLAHVYGNVVVDIGLMVPFVGARTGEVLAEVLEIAPFESIVYSSDGRALAETHYLGAKLFRHHCGRLLDEWIGEGVLTIRDAERLAAGIGAGNAKRIYQLT